VGHRRRLLDAIRRLVSLEPLKPCRNVHAHLPDAAPPRWLTVSQIIAVRECCARCRRPRSRAPSCKDRDGKRPIWYASTTLATLIPEADLVLVRPRDVGLG
jgi:hypothetical protein